MQPIVAQNQSQFKPVIVTGTPWAFGFEDGAQGRSLYDGYDLYCGRRFAEYEAGWKSGRAAAQRRRMIQH